MAEDATYTEEGEQQPGEVPSYEDVQAQAKFARRWHRKWPSGIECQCRCPDG